MLIDKGRLLVTEEKYFEVFSTVSSILFVVETNRVLWNEKPATDCLTSCTANTSTLSTRLLTCSHNCFVCHISRAAIRISVNFYCNTTYRASFIILYYDQ